MVGTADYRPPVVDLGERRVQDDEIAWMIVLGFVALAVVSAYAFYCTWSGHSFGFNWSLDSGYTVWCY